MPCWKTVSRPAKDFIFCLLKKDPLQRMTMKEVFDHEWISGVSAD